MARQVNHNALITIPISNPLNQEYGKERIFHKRRSDFEEDLEIVRAVHSRRFGIRFRERLTNVVKDEEVKSYMNDDRDEEPAPAPPPSIDPMEI